MCSLFPLDMFVPNECKKYGRLGAEGFWLLSLGFCISSWTMVAAADNLSTAPTGEQSSEQIFEQAQGQSSQSGNDNSSSSTNPSMDVDSTSLGQVHPFESEAARTNNSGRDAGTVAGKSVGASGPLVGADFVPPAGPNDKPAVAPNTSVYDDKLNQLENKLFQHNYAKDNTEDRLNRLETLIFGVNQTGTIDSRVAALVKAMPNLDNSLPPASASEKPAQEGQDIAGGTKSAPTSATSRDSQPGEQNLTNNSEASNLPEQSKYPAVTAMETKLLGKDYANEPITNRLSRLEKKVLGKASTSDDLSDRVDRLKQATGIDLAHKSGGPGDWLEEDEDESLMHQPLSSMGGIGPSNNFGNTDIYQDMQKSSGMSGSSSDFPLSSPYFPDQPSKAPPVTIKSFGLSQQVSGP